MDEKFTPEQEEEFYRTFGNITDGINVERAIEYWPKYNDMKVGFDEGVSLLGGKSREVLVCPYVFYEMCINSDGTYSFVPNESIFLAAFVAAIFIWVMFIPLFRTIRKEN